VYAVDTYTSNDKAVTFTTGRSGCGAWKDMAMDDSGNQVAVTGDNTYDVWTSNDGGSTWIASSGVSLVKKSVVAMSGDGRRIAAGQVDGSLVWSLDGGVTFNYSSTIFSTQGNAQLTSLVMSSDGNNMAVSAGTSSNGYIYTSSDGGVSWTQRTSASARKWVDLACSSNGTNLAAVVSNVDVFISNNAGANWTQLNFNRTWKAISSSSDGNILLAAATQGLFVSENRGVNWTLAAGTNTEPWSKVAIAAADPQFMVAISNPGFVWTSGNGGATWVKQLGGFGSTCFGYKRMAASENGVDVYALEDGTKPFYISHDSATTITSTLLGGSNRQMYGTATSGNGSIVVAPAFNQYAYISYNGGASFVQKITDKSRRWMAPGISRNGSVIVIPETTGYELWISTNFGSRFNNLNNTGVASPTWRSSFVSGNGEVIAALTTNGTVAVTRNYGTSWTVANLPERRTANWESIVTSYSGTKMYATYWSNLIAYSHDYGVTWSISGNTNKGLWTGIVTNDAGDEVFAAATDGSMKKSNNSGVSFLEYVQAPSRRYETMAASSDLQILYGAIGGGYVYRSGDKGRTWTTFGQLAKYP
jgi:photosystem II stability/assembly factor-like uncharacterized protein